MLKNNVIMPDTLSCFLKIEKDSLGKLIFGKCFTIVSFKEGMVISSSYFIAIFKLVSD